MHRRSFLFSLASAVSVGALGLTPSRLAAAAPGRDELLARLTADNDALIPDLLARQRASGVVVDGYGIATAHDTARLIMVLVSARHAPGSRYHGDPALLEPLERAATALLSTQHEDGTVDLIATNFH
jgi:hypothetical protein